MSGEYCGDGYKVAEMLVLADAPCLCSDCEWTGLARQLEPIEECALNAGDPSPAGRCPECDCLAYVEPDPRADFLSYCEARARVDTPGKFWHRLAGSVRKAATL